MKFFTPIFCLFILLSVPVFSNTEQEKTLGTIEANRSDGDVDVISILSAKVKNNVLTIIYRLDKGKRPNIWAMKYHTKTHIYSALKGSTTLAVAPQAVGQKGWIKYPAPEGNPEIIDLYLPDAMPLEAVRVTYE